MAIIHDTTMRPGKLDLLAVWLPAQPWYTGTGRAPELAKAGGFRLDDPQGEVGIEFMVVADASGDRVSFYQVPMTYRAGPLDGADDALIGTSEHGVLGRRWIYDGAHDPVLAAQLVALVQGAAQAQAQSVSNTPDPTVTGRAVTEVLLTPAGATVTGNRPSGTDVQVPMSGLDGLVNGQLLVRLHRLLQAGDDEAPGDEAQGLPGGAGRPCVSAPWRLPDGGPARGTFASARYLAQAPA